MSKVPTTVNDYRELARKLTGEPGLIEVGPDPVARTSRANADAFDEVRLRPRVLVDVSSPELATRVLGTNVTMPVLIAPFGVHRRFHPDGEIATVRAAGQVDTLMVVSTVTSCSMEVIAAEATGPLWFQLYILKDRELTADLVRRADRAGYRAIVVTVDNVSRVSRRRTPGDPAPELGNFKDLSADMVANLWMDHKDPSVNWSDLGWLRGLSDLPLVVKGVQTGEDAIRAAQAGASGIIVSNHGGYALPGATPPIQLVAEIAQALPDGIEVYVDSGVRRGTDVLKALALGAKAVLLGRPIAWGLMARGQAGVTDVLGIMRSELHEAMGCSGVPDLNDIDETFVTMSAGGSSRMT
jgi:4-hydroxymandelate oxidase